MINGNLNNAQVLVSKLTNINKLLFLGIVVFHLITRFDFLQSPELEG